MAREAKKNGFSADAYSQTRKDAAIWCKRASSSMSNFKSKADDIYGMATKEEIEAAHRYTSGSGYINRPLRGYKGSWDQSDFKGIGKVDLNTERPFASIDIDNLTRLINKSSYDKDIWLQRGIENEGLQGFLDVEILDEGAIKSLIGKTITDPAS